MEEPSVICFGFKALGVHFTGTSWELHGTGYGSKMAFSEPSHALEWKSWSHGYDERAFFPHLRLICIEFLLAGSSPVYRRGHDARNDTNKTRQQRLPPSETKCCVTRIDRIASTSPNEYARRTPLARAGKQTVDDGWAMAGRVHPSQLKVEAEVSANRQIIPMRRASNRYNNGRIPQGCATRRHCRCR